MGQTTFSDRLCVYIQKVDPFIIYWSLFLCPTTKHYVSPPYGAQPFCLHTFMMISLTVSQLLSWLHQSQPDLFMCPWSPGEWAAARFVRVAWNDGLLISFINPTTLTQGRAWHSRSVFSGFFFCSCSYCLIRSLVFLWQTKDLYKNTKIFFHFIKEMETLSLSF